MDRRDRTLLRSAYHDGAVDDHVGFVGEVDDFIEWAFAYHSTQTRYQHYMLNHTAEVNGDEAHAGPITSVRTDREPPNHLTGRRSLRRPPERRDSRWAIVDRVCVAEWNAESTSLITEEVIAMLPDVRHAAHGPDDPSYARPLTVARSATPSATS
jgi:hypothetical protein